MELYCEEIVTERGLILMNYSILASEVALDILSTAASHDSGLQNDDSSAAKRYHRTPMITSTTKALFVYIM